MNENEKHELLKVRETELHEQINRVIDAWEENNGIWVTGVKYFKNTGRKSLTIDTALILGRV
jgi:hypothetical protein